MSLHVFSSKKEYNINYQHFLQVNVWEQHILLCILSCYQLNYDLSHDHGIQHYLILPPRPISPCSPISSCSLFKDYIHPTYDPLVVLFMQYMRPESPAQNPDKMLKSPEPEKDRKHQDRKNTTLNASFNFYAEFKPRYGRSRYLMNWDCAYHASVYSEKM